MEWVDRLNNAIDYVESHLCDEMDSDAIGRIMACPFAVFQRAFIQIAGISLSEYIRRRKLTCAAYEIRNSEIRIIDVAVKYGYESADAFGAAFKRLHGVTPVMARKPDVTLKFFTRLYFVLSIKGVHEMDYQVMERDAFQVIGKRCTTPTGGGTWGIVKSDGSIERMLELATGQPLLGLCFGFGDDGSNDYMVGLEHQANDVPGFTSYTYPKATWLVFTAQGAIDENVLGQTWKRIYGEFLPQSEYKQADLPTIESYILWDDAANVCKVEIRIPIER